MSSLGRPKAQRKVMRLEVPMPEDVDGILQAVRSILLKDGVTQVVIKEGEPISYEREIDPLAETGPEETSAGFADLKPMEVLRNVRMEEFNVSEQGIKGVDAPAVLFWMIFLLEFESWVATHLVVSEASYIWKWIGLPPRIARRTEKFLGLRVERDESVPHDVFLICGSKHQGATLAEVGFVLKGNVGVSNERAKQEGDRGRNHPTASDQAVEALAKSSRGYAGG